MPKAKLTAALYLLVVFLSGAMVGAFVHRLYMVKTVLSTSVDSTTPRRPGPDDWRKHFIDDMRSKVKVDEQQVAQLSQIFDQSGEEMKELHIRRRAEDQGLQNQMVEKISAILREDQKPLYQQLRAEREAVRERERKRRQAEGDNRKGDRK